MQNEINQTKLSVILKKRELEKKYGSGAIILLEFHLTELMAIYESFKPYRFTVRIAVRDVIAQKINFWLQVKHAIENDATTLPKGDA